MRRDFMRGLDRKTKFINGQYDWFVQNGDSPDSARKKTIEIACRKYPNIKSLLGHAKHGRCGGNADEALEILRDCLAGLDVG